MRIKSLFFLLFIPVMVFVCLVVESNDWFQNGVKVCLGDCLFMISGRNYLLFLIIAVFMATYVFQDENQQILLTQVSKRRIYVQNFLLMLAITFMILIYVYFCTIFVGLFVSSSFLNWQEVNSIYFAATKQINDMVSFGEVFLLSFGYNFLSTVLLESVYAVVLFRIRNHIYSYLVLGGILATGYKFVRLFSGYHMFESENRTIIYVIGFVVCGILLFLSGYVNAERKDYLE